MSDTKDLFIKIIITVPRSNDIYSVRYINTNRGGGL